MTQEEIELLREELLRIEAKYRKRQTIYEVPNKKEDKINVEEEIRSAIMQIQSPMLYQYLEFCGREEYSWRRHNMMRWL